MENGMGGLFSMIARLLVQEVHNRGATRAVGLAEVRHANVLVVRLAILLIVRKVLAGQWNPYDAILRRAQMNLKQ